MNRHFSQRILLTLIGICLFILIFLITLIVLLPWLSSADTPPTLPSTASFATPTQAVPLIPATVPPTVRPNTPPPIYDGLIQTDAQGNPLFHLTLDQFIACHNHRFSQTMYPATKWRPYPSSASPYAGTESTCLAYQADPTVQSFPTVQAFICANTAQIYEISLSLSQHDWSQNWERIYKQQSLRILSVFLPELNDDQLETLYTALFEDAHSNQYISHNETPVPKTIRIADSVGCYGYIYRGMICINILPVDPARLADFSVRGITIIDISSAK